MFSRRATSLVFVASKRALALASVACAADDYQYRIDRMDSTTAEDSDSVANPADFAGSRWHGGSMRPHYFEQPEP